MSISRQSVADHAPVGGRRTELSAVLVCPAAPLYTGRRPRRRTGAGPLKKRYHIPLWLLLGLVVVLVVARLMLPHVVRNTLNGRMAHMGDYSGHVADVDIHLWRGAYSLEQLRVDKVSGKVPVPLLAAPRMDIALSWRALWRGAIRATVDFRRPVLNFVDGSGDADSQAGRGVNWRAQLQQLMPMRDRKAHV